MLIRHFQTTKKRNHRGTGISAEASVFWGHRDRLIGANEDFADRGAGGLPGKVDEWPQLAHRKKPPVRDLLSPRRSTAGK